MFAGAQHDVAAYQRSLDRRPEGFNDAGPQERAEAWSEIYTPISADAGRLLYTLVRALKPKTVVEFGMSFGVSTLHLAAAVRDNGVGRVVTTEMSAAKIEAARSTFEHTGLRDAIAVLEGDALQTLPRYLDADGAGEGVDLGMARVIGTEGVDLSVGATIVLADAADEAGAATSVLGATIEGRALYESLGWKVHAPLAGFIYKQRG